MSRDALKIQIAFWALRPTSTNESLSIWTSAKSSLEFSIGFWAKIMLWSGWVSNVKIRVNLPFSTLQE
jgi:hypothetical protein